MIELDTSYVIMFDVAVGGKLTDADATPTATLYRNGSDSGESVVVANVTTGVYTATFSTGAAWDTTDRLTLIVSFAISSESGFGGIVWESGCEPFAATTLSASERNAVADAMLVRDVDNVEDAAPADSLAALLLSTLNWTITGNTLTIYKTDGATEFGTKTLSTNSEADPISGVT